MDAIESKVAELSGAVNKLILDVQAKHTEMERGLTSKASFEEFKVNIDRKYLELCATVVKLQTPGAVLPTEPAALAAAHKAAFIKYLRKGIDSLAPEERKVMTIGDATTGGYLAPVEFTNELIRDIVEFSPFRTVARVVTTSARAKQWPKKTTSASASWVAEIGTRAETTNPKFGLEEIPTHEMFALAKVSKQDLEDNTFDILGFIRAEFAEQFGVLEGTAFISGNAVGKPEGFLSNANVTGFTGVTTSAKIVNDDLKALLYSLKEAYARAATWLWKRSSTLAISIMKDATTGVYFWQPGLQLGAPANVLGLPFVECLDMPAEAASAKAVAIGNFRQGYIIVDRIDIEVLIDPYSSKSTGCIEISARKRVGGQVVLPEAIKIYTLKA
jgi:HK97 family phage major capsid protein